MMDDPNITMEEYIRLEEEKAQKRRKVFNWETARFDKGDVDNEIDMIQSSGGNKNTRGSNKLLEESHDKINKVFIMKSFVMKLNVNIVAWNYFVNGMLFNLIKNLYVPFGIPFDPKQYFKDGDCARMLRRPRHAKGRKSCARLSGGHFIRHLAHHFGLVSPGPERQQVAAAGALEAAEDAPVLDEGAQADPVPVKAPQPLPPPPAASSTMPPEIRET
ncbi:hypothetical protein Tco_1165021 [Tanacetum coccineum]